MADSQHTRATGRPPIHSITKIDIPDPEVQMLPNGMTLYSIRGGDQPVSKIDFVFNAGRPYETKRLASTALASIIKEGTRNRSASEIAECIDRHGASISAPYSFDHINLRLVCLTKHLNVLLPLLTEIISAPSFSDGELNLFKRRIIQKLALDLSQNEVVAYRLATEQYFGSEHPYGYNSTKEAYLDLSLADIEEHYQRCISPQTGYIIAAGELPDNLAQILGQLLIGWGYTAPQPPASLSDKFPTSSFIEKEMQKAQTAVRLGCKMFSRRHPDWPVFFVLNTILGGYFGSRLMKNLREERGLTYGVSSAIESFRYDGYFSINLETERHLVSDAIAQIEMEIRKLHNELVPEEELKMVQNYISGYFLSMMDGPLQMQEVLRSNLAEDQPMQFTADLYNKIKATTSHDLQLMARKYLQLSNLSTVIIH